MKKIGVVVPTFFARSAYLRECLESIRAAGEAHVILMGPNVVDNSKPFKDLVDQIIEEPNSESLAAKITYALSSFPRDIQLISWIGDDDLLLPGSLRIPQSEFEKDDKLVLVYGACNYIDRDGKKIGLNRSGQWAIRLARIGPFLAPQPGSVFDREAFERIGGLDQDLKLAFDFDVFLSLAKYGRVKYVSSVIASYRWHENSLSVAQRRLSVREASRVRVKHASMPLAKLLRLTNPIVEVVTYVAGSLVNMQLGGGTRRQVLQ